jgi:dipeptidyl aminopeptidase/acylaminoacyl peptidase
MQVSNHVSLETFLMPYSLLAFSISEDESYLVIGMNKTGSFNLWRIDLDDAKNVTQLTCHGQKIESVHIQDETIYFTSDKNGDENMHIYSINVEGDNWKDIRTEEDCRYFFGGLSEDGSILYYTATKDNPLYLSIFSYDKTTGTETLLHKGKGAETQLLAMSPNGADFAYFVRHNHSNMRLYIQKEGTAIEVIKCPTEQYRVSDLCFINEDLVYFTTNYGEEFSYLASFQLSTGLFQKVIGINNQDIEKIVYHSPTNKVYIETKAGPIGCLYQYQLLTNDLVDLKVPTDTIQHWQVTGTGTIYLTGSSSNVPITLFQKKRGCSWKTLFDNPVPHVAANDMVQPERVHYRSFDGVEIEAMLYEAKELNRNGHTIIYPHGGPQYNEQMDYFGFFQYLLHRGFNIFAPNFRGTPNYGATFQKLIEGDWGGGPRYDVLFGLDKLIAEGRIEGDKVILFGASYGGYLSLLLFGRHQERFKACIDIFGPTSLFTLIETCPPHWRERMDSWIGHPIKDRDRLIEQSPISYVEYMKKPLLIIQGSNDPRVKRTESDQMVGALQKSGKKVEYIVYEDEGHGFSKKQNELDAYQIITQFLDKVIKDKV